MLGKSTIKNYIRFVYEGPTHSPPPPRAPEKNNCPNPEFNQPANVRWSTYVRIVFMIQQNTLTHGCLKVHRGVPIALCNFINPL